MVANEVRALKEAFRNGVVPAMATPLIAGTYEVNLPVVGPLVEFLLAAGVAGVFAGGTTGEGINLDPAQRRRLHEETVAVTAGRVPVLVHVGAQRTATAVDLARHAAEIGADAIVAVPPVFYGMNDDALARYFHAIAAAAPDLPLFMYDIPQFAVNGISPALLVRMSDELPMMAGVKTSHTDLHSVRRLIDARPEGRIVLVGNEAMVLATMALGGDGMISGLGTAVPEVIIGLLNAYGDGRMAEAQQWQQTLTKLLALLPSGKRIGGIKRILDERGIQVGPPVPELPAADEEIWSKMAPLIAAVEMP